MDKNGFVLNKSREQIKDTLWSISSRMRPTLVNLLAILDAIDNFLALNIGPLWNMVQRQVNFFIANSIKVSLFLDYMIVIDCWLL